MNSLQCINSSYNNKKSSNNKITFTTFTNITANITDLSFNKISFIAGSGQSQPSTSNLGTYSLFYGTYLISYLYQSSNTATTFNRTTFATGSLISTAMSENGLYQYFTLTNSNVYISSNSGSTFSIITVNNTQQLRSIDCSSDGKYVILTGRASTASADYYIGLSTNYGNTFSTIKGNLPTANISNECTIGCISDDGNTIYVCIPGTSGGIFKSTNALSGSITYTNVYPTTTAIFRASMSYDGTYAIFATNLSTTQLYYTTNGGISFSILNPVSSSYVSSVSMDKTGQYCMATGYISNTLYYWNNYLSSSYNTATIPLGQYGFTCCISPDATVGYVMYGTTNYPPSFPTTNLNYLYKIT